MNNSTTSCWFTTACFQVNDILPYQTMGCMGASITGSHGRSKDSGERRLLCAVRRARVARSIFWFTENTLLISCHLNLITEVWKIAEILKIKQENSNENSIKRQKNLTKILAEWNLQNLWLKLWQPKSAFLHVMRNFSLCMTNGIPPNV